MALTTNQRTVLSIADCFFVYQIPDDVLENPLNFTSRQILDRCNDANRFFNTTWDESWYEGSDATKSLIIRTAASYAGRILDSVVNFIGRARAAGYQPPDNPIEEIRKINANRKINGRYIPHATVDVDLADNIVFNYNILMSLIAKEKEGVLKLEEGTFGGKDIAAQISSMNISMNGYDLTRDEGIENLISFLPDADAIKRIRIKNSLASLSFKNRVPRILFTLNYEPDQISRGAIIGWQRIADASSFVLKRRDVFSGEEKEFVYLVKDLNTQLDMVKSYVNKFALNFYKDLPITSIWAILDTTVEKDRFYTYKIVANQTAKKDGNITFFADTSVLNFSKIQLDDIEKEINNYVSNTIAKRINDVGVDDISPYPFISKRYYGDEKYDWILAFANMQDAKKRGEKRSDVRRFSYLGARFSFIRQRIEENSFIRPDSIEETVNSLRENIITFGVSQVLEEIIKGVGLDLFFEPKESFETDTFSRATSVFDTSELRGLETVLSSIDSVTATVSVEVLTKNLLDDFSMRSTPKDGVDSPTEISVADENKFSEDPIQFMTQLSVSKDVLDLTTFEGISDFVRVIRLFFDTNPNRTNFGVDNFIDPNDPTIITVD